MTDAKPTLHLVCGKIASGKSTLAAELGRDARTVVIAKDDWLNALYKDEMSSVADYVRRAGRLRRAIGPHVVSLLRAGTSVVLDFQANTLEARNWMRGLIDQSNADHQMHLLDVADEICLQRLRARNSRGDHPFAATEEQFALITRHFVAPTADEGFTIIRHRAPN